MTFIIAITDTKKAIMAADSQTTDNNMQLINNNYKKIRKIKGIESISICFAGSVDLAEYIFDKLNNLDYFHKLSISLNIISCSQKILEFADEFININNLCREDYFCFFILMKENEVWVGSKNFKYSLYTVNTLTKEISKKTKYNGEYLYTYMSSGFVDPNKVDDIIQKYLYPKFHIYSSLKIKASNIIKDISKYDKTVNDNVYVVEVD